MASHDPSLPHQQTNVGDGAISRAAASIPSANTEGYNDIVQTLSGRRMRLRAPGRIPFKIITLSPPSNPGSSAVPREHAPGANADAHEHRAETVADRKSTAPDVSNLFLEVGLVITSDEEYAVVEDKQSDSRSPPFLRLDKRPPPIYAPLTPVVVRPELFDPVVVRPELFDQTGRKWRPHHPCSAFQDKLFFYPEFFANTNQQCTDPEARSRSLIEGIAFHASVHKYSELQARILVLHSTLRVLALCIRQWGMETKPGYLWCFGHILTKCTPQLKYGKYALCEGIQALYIQRHLSEEVAHEILKELEELDKKPKANQPEDEQPEDEGPEAEKPQDINVDVIQRTHRLFVDLQRLDDIPCENLTGFLQLCKQCIWAPGLHDPKLQAEEVDAVIKTFKRRNRFMGKNYGAATFKSLRYRFKVFCTLRLFPKQSGVAWNDIKPQYVYLKEQVGLAKALWDLKRVMEELQKTIEEGQV